LDKEVINISRENCTLLTY